QAPPERTAPRMFSKSPGGIPNTLRTNPESALRRRPDPVAITHQSHRLIISFRGLISLCIVRRPRLHPCAPRVPALHRQDPEVDGSIVLRSGASEQRSPPVGSGLHRLDPRLAESILLRKPGCGKG